MGLRCPRLAAFVSLFYPIYYFLVLCKVIEPIDFDLGSNLDKAKAAIEKEKEPKDGDATENPVSAD